MRLASVCKYSKHYPIGDLHDFVQLSSTILIATHTAHSSPGQQAWTDWFEHLQINDSFLSESWLRILKDMAIIIWRWHIHHDPSVQCRDTLETLVPSLIFIIYFPVSIYQQLNLTWIGNLDNVNLTEFLTWLHNWWIWDPISVDFAADPDADVERQRDQWV